MGQKRCSANCSTKITTRVFQVVTADHDDRVSPLHSLKYIAELQHQLCKDDPLGRQTSPVIVRVETKAGHGAGKSTTKVVSSSCSLSQFLY